MTDRYYILIGRTPVLVELMTWAKWWEKNEGRVAFDKFRGGHVSTVFLGVNHNFMGEGPPILFETMIFGGPLEGSMMRYATWKEALRGHHIMLDEARRADAKIKQLATATGAQVKP